MSDNKFVRRELQRCVRGVTIHGMLDWGIEWLLFYTNNTPSVRIGMQLKCLSEWVLCVFATDGSEQDRLRLAGRVTYTMWRVWHTSHAVCRIACDANGTRHTPCDVYHETHVYFYYFYSECYTYSKSQIVKIDVFHPEYEYIPIHLTLFPVVEDHLSAHIESCCIKSVCNIQADNIFNVSSRPRVGGHVLHIV